MTETDALLILNAVEGLTTLQVKRLLAAFGSAARVLTAKQPELEGAAQISALAAMKICHFDRDSFLKKEYDLMSQQGVAALTLKDAGYPESLRNISDPPIVLYIKGELKNSGEAAIAIVGSRQSSRYGRRIAENLSRQLAELGITVVSGLARGIDTAAHEGCLSGKGKTIAVMGCGLNHVYPPENKNLFARIGTEGAVISEFAMATNPMPFFFPRRNRIISGLSLGVVVVEAAKKSGALITARTALEQGRDVFAVPGQIDDPNSSGTNQLIKEGAKLISGAEDILVELTGELRRTVEEKTIAAKSVNRLPPVALNDDETKVYAVLNTDPIYIDEVANSSGLPMPRLIDILLKLELTRCIKKLPGRYFVRV